MQSVTKFNFTIENPFDSFSIDSKNWKNRKFVYMKTENGLRSQCKLHKIDV